MLESKRTTDGFRHIKLPYLRSNEISSAAKHYLLFDQNELKFKMDNKMLDKLSIYKNNTAKAPNLGKLKFFIDLKYLIC